MRNRPEEWVTPSLAPPRTYEFATLTALSTAFVQGPGVNRGGGFRGRALRTPFASYSGTLNNTS